MFTVNMPETTFRLKGGAGFTLIELLVAMGIIVLIAGGVIASYDKYNNSQRLKQAAQTFKNDLRLAETKALSGQKPSSGCTQLLGYQVSFTQNSYVIQAKCSEGLAGETVTVTLPLGITFASVPQVILFGVLTTGVENDVTLTLTGLSRSYIIGVSRSGDIGDLGFQ